MRKRLVMIMVCSIAGMVSAGVVVDWGNPGMISGDPGDIPLLTGSAANTTDGTLNYRNWNPASASMSSSVNAAYAAQPLHAIMQSASETAGGVGLDAGQIDDRGSDVGELWFGVKGANDTRYVAGLFSFQSADFLNGGVESGDYLSGATMNIANFSGDAGSVVRFAVKSDGAWYLSAKNATSAKTMTFANPATALWGAFTPSTAASTTLMASGGLTYDTLGSTLNGIEAVGFFFEGNRGGTARARIKVDDFQIETIPEPATLGLVATFGAGIILIRRRFMM